MTNREATQIPSDEATEEQLGLARAQGAQMGKALNHMVSQVANDGQEKRVGPYLVAYAIEDAEGMYHMNENGELEWREPDQENIHLEVSVRDAADGRFVPYLNIHARLVDSQGVDVGMHKQPFIWHPWLYHYGRNWTIQNGGDYELEIRIEAPDFPRHDKKNGERYTSDIDVTFPTVKIEVS